MSTRIPAVMRVWFGAAACLSVCLGAIFIFTAATGPGWAGWWLVMPQAGLLVGLAAAYGYVAVTGRFAR